MPERYWIMRPIEHRRWDREQMTKRMAAPPPGVFMEALCPPADDDWVCDYCNASIPLFVETPEGETVPLQIPCVGTYALCPECAMKEEGFPNSFRGVCVCGGCRPSQDPRMN